MAMTEDEKHAVKATLVWLQKQATDQLLHGWLTAMKYQLEKADWFIADIEWPNKRK